MQYSQFDNHSTSPGFLLWKLSSLWKRKIKEALSPFALTHTQYVILTVTHYLKQNNMDTSQKTVSDFSNIDVMTTSKTIRLLEKKELVNRVSDENDTRAKTVALTSKGSAVLSEAIPVVEKVDRLFFQVDSGGHHEALALFTELIEGNSVR